MAKINGLTIIPDFGFFGKDLIKGHQANKYFQSDVVREYAQVFHEELEKNYVMSELIQTHKKPSLTLEQRQAVIQANRPTIYLGCGWENKNREHNISRVFYSHKSCERLAKSLCESLEDWGHRYVFGHRVAKPVQDKSISKGPAVRVSPFALNGANAEEYLKRLRELGETMGISIMILLNELRTGRIRYG